MYIYIDITFLNMMALEKHVHFVIGTEIEKMI